MISAEDFERFCDIARKKGVKSMSMDGLSIEFEAGSPTNEIASLPTATGMPTEEQMLFWSTDTMPEVKAK